LAVQSEHQRYHEGYRAFSKPFVKGFPVLSKGFEIETEMTIHAVDKNYMLKEIPSTTETDPKEASPN
jgi:hypothetical protein